MSHYKVLGVAPGASPAELRRAYLALARRHHPDQHAGASPATRAQAERTMQRVNEAWLVLGNADRRAAYDRSRVSARGAEPVDPAQAARDGWVPGTVHPDFVPVDDDDDDADQYRLDDLDDLEDLEYGTRPVPRWQQVLPAALLGAALASLCVGLVINLVPLIGLGIFLFVAAGMGFILTPMFAVIRSARDE